MFIGLPTVDPDILSTDLAATIMALGKRASLMDTVQFLAAQARVLTLFHRLVGTQVPSTIGFVKCDVYPSPIPASTVFSTSLPLPMRGESHLRLVLHSLMRALLQKEAPGAKLSSKVGRCSEDLGFLL